MISCILLRSRTPKGLWMWEPEPAFGQCTASLPFSFGIDHDCGDRDFADAFPATEVIGNSNGSSSSPRNSLIAKFVGTDLSPVQPSCIPPNLRFEIDDCCSEWVHPPNYFDYIHIRALYGSIADWPAFYRECYKYDSRMSERVTPMTA